MITRLQKWWIGIKIIRNIHLILLVTNFTVFQTDMDVSGWEWNSQQMGKLSIPCSIPCSINCSISWELRCFPHTHLRYNNEAQTGGRRKGQAGRRHQVLTFSQTRVPVTGNREETWLTPFTSPWWVTHRFNTIKEIGAGRNSCSFPRNNVLLDGG